MALCGRWPSRVKEYNHPPERLLRAISAALLFSYAPVRKKDQNGGDKMSRILIDSLTGIPNREKLTHADLRAHYGTGQAVLLSGSGRDKKYGYRNGIQTNIGDIRSDIWCELVRELVIRSGEETLYANLAAWEKERNYCSRTKSELEEHTLQLYAMRIFDMPDWVDYAAFSECSGYHPTP